MNKLFSFFSPEDVAKSVYGEPGSGTEHNFDPFIAQGYNSTCAVRSQQIILRDFGVDISQEALMNFAEQNGWFSEESGTPMAYVGYILQSQGVSVHQNINCTMYDLVNELSQGHRVIVGVDADELWHDGFMGLKGDWNDLVNGETPNHALIVAGVEVNPNDPTDVKVILTDPGSGDLRVEYELDKFMDAWQDSDCFMVATDEPAPYQYDPVTGREIPSNFYTQAFINNNSYPLSEEDLVLPDGYLAEDADGHLVTVGAHYSEGHLDTVPINGKDIEYSKFAKALGNANSLGVETFNLSEFKSAFLNLLGLSEESKPEAVIEIPGQEEEEEEEEVDELFEELDSEDSEAEMNLGNN